MIAYSHITNQSNEKKVKKDSNGTIRKYYQEAVNG